jgi:large subunit ribosomal protein L23
VHVLHVDDVGVADLVRAATLVLSQAALDNLTSRARKATPVMDHSQVIIRPVVSEKSYVLATADKYTFRVHDKAHKTQIKQAVEALFNVTVVEVRTSKVPSKPKRRGVTAGRTRAWKKAVVQIAPGQTIPIFPGPRRR